MIVVVHSACYTLSQWSHFPSSWTTSSSSLAQSTFTEELTTLQGEREGLELLAQTQGELKTLKEDGVKKTEMITKVCTISRQFIMQCVCMMLVYAAPVA